MTSSCILGSIQVKKAENPNFLVFDLICLKFGMGGNFEMLITKRKPKLKSENNLRKKLQFSTDFSQALFNNIIAMATVDVPWDWFASRIKAY